MPLSADPSARAAQLANLRPQNSIKHGAYSADLLKPERERILGELLASFPSVRRDRLELAAAQRARIVLLQAYVEAVGVLRHKGRGETYPAVALLSREESAYRAELGKIEDLQREAGAAPHDALAAIVAELAEGEHGGGAEEVGAEAQREAGGGETLASIAAELAAEGDDDDGEQDAAVELPDSPAIDGEGDGRG